MNAKVYTVVKGLELNIGGYGVATNEVPAIVPDEVADQLEAEIRGHRTVDGVEQKYSKSAVELARRLRVEREEAPKPAGKMSAADLKAAQAAPSNVPVGADEKKG